jgi:translation initiation factor eIF-2B subunit delta
VLQLFLQAHQQGIDFKVVVVDARPKLEGLDTAEILSKHGIKCTYVYTNALVSVMKQSTKVIMGASSILSNGDLMSRTGSSLVAMAAYDHKVPVMVLCEMYKFSDTVRLDSFVWNEIGNPDALVDISNIPPSKRLPSSLTQTSSTTATTATTTTIGKAKLGVLEHWRNMDTLKLINLTYDITPAKFITMVCCEFGQIQSTLVLSVLRSQNLFQA